MFRFANLNNLVAANIKHAKLLVTAGCGNQRAVVVPAHALNDLHVSSNLLLLDCLLHIPKLNRQIGRSGQKNVLSHGIEENLADLATVGCQTDHGLEIFLTQLIGDLVQENLAVLRSRSDQVVVEGREIRVENSSRVSTAQGKGVRDLA